MRSIAALMRGTPKVAYPRDDGLLPSLHLLMAGARFDPALRAEFGPITGHTRPSHLVALAFLEVDANVPSIRRLNRRRSESFRGQRSPAQRRRKAAAGRHRDTAKRGSATGGNARRPML
jgi:hypothetical protein